MLVIISDLHLTDGAGGGSLGNGAFDLFADRLRDLAQRASLRAGGAYRPIERIDLVLLGDVLDLIRSGRWLQAGVRPWQGASAPEMISTVGGIVDDVLRYNAAGLADLRSLAAEGAVSVPPAGRNGQLDYDGQWQPVLVRTHYMVGNHDWPLHLRGAGYDMIRQKIVHQMGLANVHNAPFPHEPSESEELLEALRRHRVLARHGDVFDPLNFSDDRDSSSLGDAIVIELLQRFTADVARELGPDIPYATQAGLAEIDNIRPLLMIPVWIEGLLERTCPSAAVRKRIKQIWDQLTDEFLELEIVRERDSVSPIDLVDGLQIALKFSRRLSLGGSAKTAAWLQSLRGAGSDSYYTHALAEPDFRNRRARHIVYGHTHQAESLPLDASYADAFVLNQMYFNAGTWRRIYRQTQFAPGEHEFIGHECLSYLAFFHGDERGGRPFETWSGTLGVGAMEGPQRPTSRTAFIEPASVSTSQIKPPHAAAGTPQRRMAAARK
jgi:UDP-2,3-diacylglucosamine pyrophosphatase LpxH